MKILFQSDFFEPEYFVEWEIACKKLGVEYHTINSAYDVYSGDWGKYFLDENPYFIMGSIQFLKHCEKRGYYGEFPVTWENYKCSYYYPYLGNYLLAQDYSMLPYGDLARLQNSIWNRHGNNDCIFVRPDSGEKPFTGLVLARNAMKHENSLRTLELSYLSKNELIVVSEPQNIIREWRFVIINNEVITGSLYKENGIIKHENVDGKWAYLSSITPSFVAATYANQMNYGKVSDDPWSPDTAYTMDICETKDGNLHLLEINGFACAGLYACDRTKILTKLKEVFQ